MKKRYSLIAALKGNEAQNRRGSGLIEFIIASALLASIISILYLTLLNLLNSQNSLKLAYQQLYCYMRFKELLREVGSNLDQHRLKITPRLHPQNIIKFSDGTPNQIMQAAGERAPAFASDAITTVRTEPLNSHDVVSASRQGSDVEFVACPRFAKSLKRSDYRSYIGLSLSGFVELQGSVSAVGVRRPCRLFRLRATGKSMLSGHNSDAPLESVRTIIPINRQITYYLDKSGQVRLLGHAGELNIENQPLFGGVESIKLSLHSVLGGSIVLVSGTISFSEKKSFTTTTLNRLGRTSHHNFLFNKP